MQFCDLRWLYYLEVKDRASELSLESAHMRAEECEWDPKRKCDARHSSLLGLTLSSTKETLARAHLPPMEAYAR